MKTDFPTDTDELDIFGYVVAHGDFNNNGWDDLARRCSTL